MKSNIFTTGIIIATIILATVAIFTAYKLYQLRSESVAPNAPVASDATSGASSLLPEPCQTLSFAILEEKTIALLEENIVALAVTLETTVTPTSTPTNTPSSSPTPTNIKATATLTPTGAPIGGETEGAATQLPEAGVGIPTIFAASAGLLFLILSFALVL